MTRTGVHPLDMDVGKWLRKHAPEINPIVAMNKSESLCDGTCSLAAAIDEAHMLGFGNPIAISAETGLGMTELYKALRPLLEDYMIQVLNGKKPLAFRRSRSLILSICLHCLIFFTLFNLSICLKNFLKVAKMLVQVQFKAM